MRTTTADIKQAMKAPHFDEFGRRVLDIRRRDGVRGMPSEEARFKNHIATASWSQGPIKGVRTVDLAVWRRELADKGLAQATISKVVSLVSGIFGEAVELGLREDNPVLSLKRRRARKSAANQHKEHNGAWDFLTLHEQRAILECPTIPEPAKLMMAFAWGTGLRQGEQYNLALKDLHVDGEQPYVFVRVGSDGLVPKSGKVRKVPLFGDGLYAAKRWLEIRHNFQGSNPMCLVFPTVNGYRRREGAPLEFKRWLRDAGVTRSFRWHDLRHTCGTSLFTGVWGRKWTLKEISLLLGHARVSTTEIYAHLVDEDLFAAATTTKNLP